MAGPINPSMDRLYLNMAIYYEEQGDVYKAYDFFRKWYLVGRELFGLQHPKTRRPINTLNEPMYRRIAEERGDPYAGTEDLTETTAVNEE